MTIRDLKKLMIDDFVYSRKHHQIIRICAVHPGYIQCYVSGCLTEISNEDIEAIELTEEFLRKLGWGDEEKDDGARTDYIDIDTEGMIEIRWDGDFWWTKNCAEFWVCPLKYVHQLQQVLRLNGIEKEIEL